MRDPRDLAAPLVVCDTETGSLDRPHLSGGRRIWEFAAIRREPDTGAETTVHAFVSDFDVDRADPVALEIGRFHERHPSGKNFRPDDFPATAVMVTEVELADLVDDLMPPGPQMFDGQSMRDRRPHVAGAVPGFEDLGLFDLLARHHGLVTDPPWHHHLIDVENLAAGRLGWLPPYTSRDLCAAFGIYPEDYGTAHEALTDTRWAAALLDAVMADAWAEVDR